MWSTWQWSGIRGWWAEKTSELAGDLNHWLRTRGPWWATSVIAHAVVMSATMLILGTIAAPRIDSDAPMFTAATVDTTLDEPIDEQPFTTSNAALDNSPPADDLLADSMASSAAGDLAGTEGMVDSSGAGGVDLPDVEPSLEPGGIYASKIGDAVSNVPNAPGPNPKNGNLEDVASCYAARRNRGKAAPFSGVSKTQQGAVALALKWIKRHQNTDGSWSLENYSRHCTDASCVGKGSTNSDAGATALALLPFLAAGQTHKAAGPYQHTIQTGLYWLTAHQDRTTGDLSAGSPQIMYTHGLATICLCEAYGMTSDSQIGQAAQQAVAFIETAQGDDGGWRYKPLDLGDTSVVGWQVMALKSAQMANLTVSKPALESAKKYLASASQGYGGRFAYQPGGSATPAMSSVGLLCSQYLGAAPHMPAMQEGQQYLLENLPDAGAKNIYYWYYATQVMHNLQGPHWDEWNRKIRRVLVDSQARTGCAAGSWDPSGHPFGDAGGRLMVTSLSCLTLEVYYRYLPLYKLEGGTME